MDLPNTKTNHIMFSLQQDDDLVVDDNPCLISFQQDDLNVSMVDGMGINVNNHPESSTRKRGGTQASNKPNLGGDGEDDRTQKKLVHREMEKQRRQEMTKLYASLRDLLPLEVVKGNRSVSDHMHQAVHYIKQMEENMKELGMKRDRLKENSNNNESSTNHLPNTVSVRFCNGGVAILIDSCSIEDGFILSGLLNAVVEEGLTVTSCVSTKVNDRLLHSIQTEVNDLALINLSMLQQTLVFVANTQPDFNLLRMF